MRRQIVITDLSCTFVSRLVDAYYINVPLYTFGCYEFYKLGFQ